MRLASHISGGLSTWTGHQPRIIAHRGASGVALENSLEAFRVAVRAGVDGIELDIHVTAAATWSCTMIRDVPGIGPDRRTGPGDGTIPTACPTGRRFPTLGESPPGDPWTSRLLITRGLDRDQEPFPSRPRGAPGVHCPLPLPPGCAVHSFDHRIIRRIWDPGVLPSVAECSPPPIRSIQLLRCGRPAPAFCGRSGISSMRRWSTRFIAPDVRSSPGPSTRPRRPGGSRTWESTRLCGNWPERLKVW